VIAKEKRRREVELLFAEVDALGQSLADKLLSFTTQARAIAPDLIAAEDRMIARLVLADTPSKAPKCGSRLPGFTLPDCSGELVDLQTLLAGGPVILNINRGHWCPYDRLQLRDLARALPVLGLGPVHVVSVVPETIEFSLHLARENDLPFRVLSDRNLGYALTLGLPVWSGDDMIRAFRRYGIDLPLFQGDPGWMQPIPATFVIDKSGYVRARFIGSDIRERMSLQEIEAVLRHACPSAEQNLPSRARH